MASRIEDYGLIGNTHTSALVSRSGSIDWLCAPRFDSDACFTALVGYDEHGRWSLRPTVDVREIQQRYRDDTMILETDFICDCGTARLIDFMPVGSRCDVIRIVEGIEGELPFEMLLSVRFGYGANAPLIQNADNGMFFMSGPDALVLRCPFSVEHSRRRASSYFRVRKGERIPIQLTWFESHEIAPESIDVEKTLAATEAFWREWAGLCAYQGRWKDAVLRSLIILKAMTYAPTGAIVAAPTTSLPEEIGGVRNWDYRFCWVRDASLTLDSLMIGGYVDEALAFRDWLFRAVAGDPPDLQIMYNVFGGRRLTEFELKWLPGYEGSKPVRAGNAASDQFQLDIYGEAMASLYSARKMGMKSRAEISWPVLRDLITFMEDAWQHPDDGIWEVRGGRRHFTHSKVMAWTFFDRAVKGIDELGIGGDESRKLLPHLTAVRDRIHREICSRGFNPRVQAFTQSYGSEVLDASVLVIPQYGFLPATDPRMQSTVAAIEKDLLRDGFVLRYDTKHGTDGLPGSEGAFLACTFWLADNYAFAGRLREAEQLFERLLSLRNHLGLLSEEYDPKLQRQIGNFPQAFSHLALIRTAQIIDNLSTRGVRAA
jgi:GH15 family glucan-1,4-alpha-glucosidase